MRDECILIPLTQGYFAKIDAADADLVSGFKWLIIRNGNPGYAARRVGDKTIYMHRVINQTPDGKKTDHINHDTLDNRRCNLQTVDDTQSLHRRMPYGKSGFRGVRRFDKGGGYNARIRKGGVEYDLGSYRTPEAAAVAYNEKALELYGPKAFLNEVDPSLAEERLPRWHNNASGERHGMSKLTDEDVKSIRERKATGARGIGVQLAREYGISYTHLKRILNGNSRS